MNKNALLFLAIHAKGGVKDLKLKIIGSGGMSIIPSSFCKCKICEEARRKGGRYERLGPSLYIDDIKMLIDTPEDIAVACNRQRICYSLVYLNQNPQFFSKLNKVWDILI